jgi:hypothetical protein
MRPPHRNRGRYSTDQSPLGSGSCPEYNAGLRPLPLPAVEADPIGVLRRIPDHPKNLYVREDYLLDGILDFFAQRILHPDRRQRLDDQLQGITHDAGSDLERQRRTLQRAIRELSAQQQRLAATLACQQDDDGKLFAQVRQQFYDLERQLAQRRHDLAAVDERQADIHALELMDALPTISGRLGELPELVLRRLFQAFQLRSSTTGTPTGPRSRSRSAKASWVSSAATITCSQVVTAWAL